MLDGHQTADESMAIMKQPQHAATVENIHKLCVVTIRDPYDPLSRGEPVLQEKLYKSNSTLHFL